MNHIIFKAELWRISLLAIISFFIGLISGYIWQSFTLFLFIYSAWLLFKLEELLTHLKDNKKIKTKLLSNKNSAFDLIYSELKKNEREKIKKKQRKRDKGGLSLSHYKKIMKHLSYALVLMNENNEIDWMNQKSKELLGLNLKKDRKKRIENLIREPKLTCLLKKEANDEIKINSPKLLNLKLAVQIIRISPNLKLLIARDISESFNLQESSKDFISNASHELRTPLTVIFGYLEMLKDDKSLSQSQLGLVQTSFEQSNRMKNIVSGLLNLSRLEEVGLNLKETNQKIKLSELLKPILSDQALLNNQLITTKIDPQLGIIGSEIEIVSLCTNLIKNAFIHNPKNTKVEIIWQNSKSSGAELIIRDNGIGIASKHLLLLTNRFYRVENDNKNMKNKEGTGLGLSICNMIVKRHESELFIKSKVNKGSEFKVIFPKKRTCKLSSV